MSATPEQLEKAVVEAEPENTSDTSTADADAQDLIVEDLLVEDVSIDGMCGVY